MTVRIQPAAEADDEDLRRLLREEAMEGWIRLALEREPRFFAGAPPLDPGTAFLARDGEGIPVGLCTLRHREVFLRGEAVRLPYLGGLRVRPGFRHRAHLLREGFDAVRSHMNSPFAFTSLASDNPRARRLLEAGLPGFPCYTPVGEMGTFALRTGGRVKGLLRPLRPGEGRAFAELFNRRAAACDFSPVLEGTPPGEIWVREEGGELLAGLSLWDQRAVKQTRVLGYRAPLRPLRPLLGAVASVLGVPSLPAPGQVLPAGYLAFAAGLDLDLVREALALAAQRGLDVLLLGLPAGSPLAASMTPLDRALAYRTCIETVHWPGDPAPRLDGRPVHPEIALL